MIYQQSNMPISTASNLSEVLTKAIEDVQSVPLRTIKAARVLVVDSEWAGAQSASDQQVAIDLARAVYNRCQEWRRHCSDGDTMRRNSHLRVLSLSILKDWERASIINSEIAVMSKHWGRTGLQFVLCAECARDQESDIEQAQLCFRHALSLLQRASDPGAVDVLEAQCMIKGWQAHLNWVRGDVRQVIKGLEDAHTALAQHGGGQCPLARRYLSEHCAYAFAVQGLPQGTSGIGSGDDAALLPMRWHGIEHRSLIRLLDLSVELLGDDTGDAQALRDRSLRLKSRLVMLEGDFDDAAETETPTAALENTLYSLRPLGADGRAPVGVTGDGTPTVLGRYHGIPDEQRFRSIHRRHCRLQHTEKGLEVQQLGKTPVHVKRGLQLMATQHSGDALTLLASDELHLLHPTQSVTACAYTVAAGAHAKAASEQAPLAVEAQQPSDGQLLYRRLLLRDAAGVVVQEEVDGTSDVLVLFDNGEEDIISRESALRAIRAARLHPAVAATAATGLAAAAAMKESGGKRLSGCGKAPQPKRPKEVAKETKKHKSLSSSTLHSRGN